MPSQRQLLSRIKLILHQDWFLIIVALQFSWHSYGNCLPLYSSGIFFFKFIPSNPGITRWSSVKVLRPALHSFWDDNQVLLTAEALQNLATSVDSFCYYVFIELIRIIVIAEAVNCIQAWRKSSNLCLQCIRIPTWDKRQNSNMRQIL